MILAIATKAHNIMKEGDLLEVLQVNRASGSFIVKPLIGNNNNDVVEVDQAYVSFVRDNQRFHMRQPVLGVLRNKIDHIQQGSHVLIVHSRENFYACVEVTVTELDKNIATWKIRSLRPIVARWSEVVLQVAGQIVNLDELERDCVYVFNLR